MSKSKCTKHTIVGQLLHLRCRKSARPLARSTSRSQNVQNTPASDHFWKLRRRKSARRCGANHISKSKCTKHTTYGPLLDVQSSFRMAGAGIVHLLKGEQNVRGFCSIAKNDGRRGICEEDLQRFIFRGRRSTRDIFIGAVRRSGR